MSSSASIASIGVSVNDGVATVELHNPTRRNAVTKDMCLRIQELMPELDADPEVVVLTLRGAGTTFSAGASINELPSILLDGQEDGRRVDHLSLADDAIASVSKPTIALVDGDCMGGGWQIASACDFVLASARSVFAITPAKLGVIYPRPGIERLVRQVGPANAKFILLTGQAFSAAQARELGLVADVVPDDEFVARVESLVDRLKSNSRFSMHTLKALVDLEAAADPSADAAWDEAWSAMTDGPDMATGVDAFLNRTKPSFTWAPAR